MIVVQLVVDIFQLLTPITFRFPTQVLTGDLYVENWLVHRDHTTEPRDLRLFPALTSSYLGEILLFSIALYKYVHLRSFYVPVFGSRRSSVKLTTSRIGIWLQYSIVFSTAENVASYRWVIG